MSSRLREVKVIDCLAEDCELKFPSQRQVIFHIKKDHNDEVTCPDKDCEKVLKAGCIYRHIKEIHGEVNTMQECQHCGELKSKKNIGTHLKRCANDSPKIYVCKVKDCKASFAVESDFVKHTKNVHTVGKKCPFSNCQTVVKQAHLMQHIKLVHQKKKETCSICKKQISYVNFYQHFVRCNADGREMYECQFGDCSATFADRRYMILHIRTVHEKITKTCRNCGKEISSTNFAKHTRHCGPAMPRNS